MSSDCPISAAATATQQTILTVPPGGTWAGFITSLGPVDLDFAAATLTADQTYTIQVAVVVTHFISVADLPNGTITIAKATLAPTPVPGPQDTTCQTAQALVEGEAEVQNTITGEAFPGTTPPGLPPITSANFYSFTPASDGVYDISIQCPDAPTYLPPPMVNDQLG